MTHIELEYPADGGEERLDQFIATAVEGLSRSGVQRLIEAEQVTVDGTLPKPSLKLRGGERVVVDIPPPIPARPEAEEIPLDILYEDSDLVVVNKPAGLVVHPGAGTHTGTLVNALLWHCQDLSGIGGEIRPGIVHRIDKDTSGILVVAKNDRTHLGLSTQFSEHTIKRIYQALVYGSPKEEKGKISGTIGRHPTDRKKMSGRARHGKESVTHWRVDARYPGTTLLRLRLETGRTHQIRVHMAEAGYPLLGDPVYGGAGRINNLQDPVLRKLIRDLGRQALHARTLGFIHPTTREYLEFETELPEDMVRIIHYLEETNS